MFFKNILIVFCVVILSILGCNKDEDSVVNLNSSIAKLSSVAVFNAIPNSTGLTLYIGQGTTQQMVISDSDKLIFGSYVTYKNWYAGSFDIMVQNQIDKSREQVNYKLLLNAGKFYSLFLYQKNVQLQYLLTDDNIINPKDDYVKIRIAHLCEDIANMSIMDGTGSSLLFQNIKFETITNFIEIDLNKLKDLTIQIDDHKINFKDMAIFVNKGIYTIMLLQPLDDSNDGKITDYISVIKQ